MNQYFNIQQEINYMHPQLNVDHKKWQPSADSNHKHKHVNYKCNKVTDVNNDRANNDKKYRKI